MLGIYVVNRVVFLSLAFSFVFAYMAEPVHALLARGDLKTGVKSVNGRKPSASFDLCAHSLQRRFQNPQIGPNAKKKGLEVTSEGSTKIAVGDCSGSIKIGPKTYSPLVGFRRKKKPLPANFQNVTSESGVFVGDAFQSIEVGNPEVVLSAVGVLLPGDILAAGEAAGEAIDPFPLDPGTIEYAPEISVVLETDKENDFAGARFFATDSRFANFLWELEVLLEGLENLEVEFVSNPVLNLDNAVVENEVFNALEISSGSVTLTSFQLFQATYSVNSEITFSEGLDAGIESVAVPETPSSSSLLLLGCLGGCSALSRCGRKRQN